MKTFDLAALLSKVNLDQNEVKVARTVLSQLNSDQQLAFFNYCKQWKLAPWVYSQMNREELLADFEPEHQTLFKAEYAAIKTQNEKRNSTAAIFLEEFIKEGIDVIILKGNYLAHNSYEDVGYKRMNDFDILIRKEDWDRIQDVYLRLGYIPLGFGWSGEKEKPASFSHVGMSFISSDYSCIIGSQWGLKSPTTSFTVPIEKAWSTALPFNFCGVDVKCLSPEFNLLHLILHLGIYKCGIRDCMDLYNLSRTEKVDWDEMKDLIIESNAKEKTIFALEISNLCTSQFDEKFIKDLKGKQQGFLHRRLKKRKYVAETTGDFQNSYNDYFQDIEKQVIYFNLFPKFHVKFVFYFKIIRMIYFPKMEFALRLNDQLKEPSLGHKIISIIKAPYFVFYLIAQEIGWKFTVLLFVKLGVDLLISLKNYFVRPLSYFDYLEQKGVDLKDIQKAVKNIQ